ncbi:MAG TPA: hypothetical protein DD473_15510 [Planctomycetaceae bacterium]|nr:hypothetical protein [Planctomycetaceae bacterium]|tara:strand:+ start:18 stop:626 length:609 start_codon:yes stop_codon:yes gene_type:complete
MSKPSPFLVKTRVYPEFAKTSFLVYGLIVSIAIFFVGAIVAYLGRFVFSSHPITPVVIPPILWINTLLLLIGSHLLFRGYRAVRREQLQRFRRYLCASLTIACIFCVLQSIGMYELLDQHWQQSSRTSGSVAAVLLMVFLHVAHFFAGLLGLAFVTFQAFQGRYDHEYHNGVRLVAIYWRFLDLIWLLLLLLFYSTGTSLLF